jgi:cytochrome c553
MWPARSSALRTRDRLAIAFLALNLASVAHAADAEAGERKARPCAECHGEDGNSTDPSVPSLAAQAPLYIYFQLLQYREERRRNDQMSPFAAKLSDADMQDIAAYYSGQELRASGRPADETQAEAGRIISDRHHCGSCHTSTYAGQKHIPRIAGLQYDYLVKELRGFRTGERPDIDGNMASAAQPLTDKEISDISGFLAGLR